MELRAGDEEYKKDIEILRGQDNNKECGCRHMPFWDLKVKKRALSFTHGQFGSPGTINNFWFLKQ
jgi:hypothetical protein